MKSKMCAVCLAVILGFSTFTPLLVSAVTSSESSNGTDTSALEGTKSIIWRYLMDAGYSQEAAAGVMGNLDIESGYRPDRIQGGRTWEQFIKGAMGIGLAQWTDASRQDELFGYASSINAEWYDIDVQTEYLLKSMECNAWYSPYFDSLDAFKASTDIEATTKAFMCGYERPLDQGASALALRVTAAKAALDECATTTDKAEVKGESKQGDERKEIELEVVADNKKMDDTKDTKDAKSDNNDKRVSTGELEYAQLSRVGQDMQEDLESATLLVSPYTNTLGTANVTSGTVTNKMCWNNSLLFALLIGTLLIFGGYKGLERLGFVDILEDSLELVYYRRKYGSVEH